MPVAEKFASVDDYIASFPPDVQQRLGEVREIIHASVPGCDEAIRYNMPAVTLDGSSLVHFAAWKKFVSLYPAPFGDPDFDRDAEPYRGAKDALQFPYAKPLPRDLVARMVALLVARRT